MLTVLLTPRSCRIIMQNVMAIRNPESEYNNESNRNFIHTVSKLKKIHDDRLDGSRIIQFHKDSTFQEIFRQVNNIELTRPGLEKEWERISQIYIKLGFHSELELSQSDYLSLLPIFDPQPDAFVGRFNVPILVETRIAPERQAELAGLEYFIDRKVNEIDIPPYASWMQTGEKYLDRKARDVCKKPGADERMANLYDGVALLIANPNVLTDHSIALPGTILIGNKIPYLNTWITDGKKGIGYADWELKHPKFGTATCGIEPLKFPLSEAS